MSAVKEEAQKMIANLPDDCSYEDIQYHLYVVEKIQKSLEKTTAGNVVPHSDAKERMQKWLSN